MRLRLRTLLVCLNLAVASALGAPRSAHALDRDVKAVLVVSAYGAVGGTVLGLALLPFNQKVQTVFIGTSLGLYLGIAVGLYYVFDRREAENAMRSERMRAGARLDRRDDREGLEVRALALDSADQELRRLAASRVVPMSEMIPESPMRVDVPLLRF